MEEGIANALGLRDATVGDPHTGASSSASAGIGAGVVLAPLSNSHRTQSGISTTKVHRPRGMLLAFLLCHCRGSRTTARHTATSESSKPSSSSPVQLEITMVPYTTT